MTLTSDIDTRGFFTACIVLVDQAGRLTEYISILSILRVQD